MGIAWQDFQVHATWDNSSGAVSCLLPDLHKTQQSHPTPKPAEASSQLLPFLAIGTEDKLPYTETQALSPP